MKIEYGPSRVARELLGVGIRWRRGNAPIANIKGNNRKMNKSIQNYGRREQ